MKSKKNMENQKVYTFFCLSVYDCLCVCLFVCLLVCLWLSVQAYSFAHVGTLPHIYETSEGEVRIL